MAQVRHLERNPDLIAAEMDSDTVMMDVESGNYFSLNPVGSTVWEALEFPATTETIISAVRESFDVTNAAALEFEISMFLDELLEKKLIWEVSN